MIASEQGNVNDVEVDLQSYKSIFQVRKYASLVDRDNASLNNCCVIKAKCRKLFYVYWDRVIRGHMI